MMQRVIRSPWAPAMAIVALAVGSAAAQGGGQAPGGAGGAGVQTPGGPGAPGGRGGRGGGRGGGGGRFGGPPIELSAARQMPAEQQAARFKDPNWRGPRTAWGHPDLEGIWTTDDMLSVPVNRPANQADREVLTQEEFLQRARGDEGQRDSAVNRETILRNERGTRTFGYTSLVIDPPNGRMQMRPEYQKQRAAASDRGTFGQGPFNWVEDFTLYDRCVTRGVLGSTLPVIYGNGIRIVQTPTEVVLSYEMIHDTRVIPLDNRPQLGSNLRQYLGSSRGRWEGDTLVIETANLTDRTSIGSNGNGTRHSDQMKLTEWITRIDPDMIDYRVRVEDPVAYAEPFTMRLTFTTQPGYEMYEYACHEGNGAVKYALSADRAHERAVADAIAKGETPPVRHMRSPYGPPSGDAEIIDINSGR